MRLSPSFRRLVCFAFLAGLALPGAGFAKLSLAPLFADHGVLQRDKPITVWGTASAGEKISVSFSGQTRETTASAEGKWKLELPALPANATASDLVVKADTTLTIHDVLVGEVWFCSGQSNMTFPMERSDGAKAEIAAANLPLIRQFAVLQTAADQPADTVKGGWRICSPETVGRFTAVGYYFGRELFDQLKVPIGLIHCAWGGTPIESWIANDILHRQPSGPDIAARWQLDLAAQPANQAAYDALLNPWLAEEAKSKAAGEKSHQAFIAAHPRPVVPANIRPSSAPSSLYNGMVHPLLPYTLRGFIWYQGEANTGHPNEYHGLFTALITSWRSDFQQGDLPFYWVSLANYKGDPSGLSSALLREAQNQTLALPQTGQALAIDIGNPNDIHPTDKKEVGHRLALIAEAQTYRQPVEFSGPQFSDVSPSPKGNALVVRLTHADGLVARGGAVHSLEIAGADKKFHAASGVIVDHTLLVSSPEVAAPVAVRYAFSNSPDANLYNAANLPAVPFRSDRW